MYISKAIVVCAAFMKSPLQKEDVAELMKTIMSGLQNHLDSGNPAMRRIGEFLSAKYTIHRFTMMKA